VLAREAEELDDPKTHAFDAIEVQEQSEELINGGGGDVDGDGDSGDEDDDEDEGQSVELIKGREAPEQPQRRSVVMLAVACVLAFALVVGSIFAISKADKPNIVVIKGPNDPYLYEAYTLPNGLEVLLVSVPGADRAAAALSVKVHNTHMSKYL
jgi:hypothetical protein